MTDYQNEATAAQQAYRDEIDRIDKNPDLNDDAKAKYKRAAWDNNNRKVSELKRAHEKQTADTMEVLRHNIYGAPGKDPARLAGWRDAMHRAREASAKGVADLQRLYEFAKLTSDEDQMHAAFVIADQVWSDEKIVLDYVNRDPDLKRDYQELFELEHYGNGSIMGTGFAFTMPDRPDDPQPRPRQYRN